MPFKGSERNHLSSERQEPRTIGSVGPCLSLVVPIFNEQNAIRPFLEQAVPVLEKLCATRGGHEVLFVDDGSSDGTIAALVAARSEFAGIRAIILSRNFGKEAALAAGLRHATGRAVIPIDVDLQDPPELIPEMFEKWDAGARIVNAVRTHRGQEGVTKRLSARAFYRAYNALAEQPLARGVGDFRLLDRQIVDVLNDLPERSRFTKGLYAWAGYGVSEVHYERGDRQVGASKFTWWGLWNLALDGITSSTTTPLRIWSYFGGCIALLSFIYALFIVFDTLIHGRDTPGYASLITAVLMFGGLNLLALGVIGEYVGRIFNETRQRPLYLVESSLGFDDSMADPGEQQD